MQVISGDTNGLSITRQFVGELYFFKFSTLLLSVLFFIDKSFGVSSFFVLVK